MIRSRLLPAILCLALLPVCAVAASSAKPRPLAAPTLEGPADQAGVDAVPAFKWKPVRGAASYEFQLSADGAFRSSVFASRTGSIVTKNTAATVITTLTDGSYFWRVRAVGAKGTAGRWSKVRTLRKSWSKAPTLTAPGNGATVNSPDPLVLSWSPVANAFKYNVQVFTDPGLSSPAPEFGKPVETSATDFAVGISLPVGNYFWAVTPLDADKHKGLQSAVGSFAIAWPSATPTRVTDLNDDPRVYDPQFSWDDVAGAARYEVEINGSSDFALGSKVCCKDPTTGTSLSPTKVLPNNTGPSGGYFWRVRAIDADGNAGVWNVGPDFPKFFSPTSIDSVPNLRLRDYTTDQPQAGIPQLHYPAVVWDPAPGASSYEIQVAPVDNLTATFKAAAGTTVTVSSTAHMIPNSSITFATGESHRIISVLDATHVVVDSAITSAPALDSAATTSSGLCNWTPPVSRRKEFWDVRTAATAWVPLANSLPTGSPIGRLGFPNSFDSSGLIAGNSYCIRIRARGDRDANSREVVSAWTELGDFLNWRPTFEFDPASAACDPSPTMQSSDYMTPSFGASSGRLPYFAWTPICGASSYWVVVAKDESFTDVVDVALTWQPMYAPRFRSDPRTYPDEASSYFWAVIPADGLDGSSTHSAPENNAPQQFQKQSTPPTLLGPIGGASVPTQPTFRWTAAEGARDYRLEVAQDPTFADPIDDVTTDATGYTSSSTYPADTVLYWRVRADDENKTGLTWSNVETFRRTLPAPRPSSGNPDGGRTIPVLRWSPVTGAVGYDVHVDQPDGTQKDFALRSTAFSPTAHYGTGVWQWKVRAKFPKIPSGSTPGAYSNSSPFTRFIGSPSGARGTTSPSRVLLSWDPVEAAKSYRVEISKSNSFTLPITTVTTDNTSVAPLFSGADLLKGERVYWRVASLDEGNTLGGWTSGSFGGPKKLRVRLKGSLRRGHTRKIIVRITDTHGHRLRKVKVQASGAGVTRSAKRTPSNGVAVFQLSPRKRGKVSFVATKGGYRTGSASLKVKR